MTTENNGMYMPVAPAYGGGGGGFGFGDNGAWWLLILLVAMGGWGNGFGGGFGGGGAYPFMMANNDVQRGFDQSAVISGITGVQNAVTTGFGNVQTALASGFANAEIASNARQIADMQMNYAAQTATLQGFNGIQNQLSQCCCDNRAGLADLRYSVATEGCADRNALATALRDVLEANNASTQRILDTMCQDKIDAKNERIAELQNQLTMANLAASQTLQTQQILAGQQAGVNAVERYLAPTPIPAYIVPQPGCATQNYGCGVA